MKWNFSFLKRRDKEPAPEKTTLKHCTEQIASKSFEDKKRKLVRSTTFSEGHGNTYKGFNSHLYREEGELLSGDEFNPSRIMEKSRSFDFKTDNGRPKLANAESILTVCPNCKTSFDVFNAVSHQRNQSSQPQLSTSKYSGSHYSIHQHLPYAVKQPTASNSMSDSGIFELLNTSDTSQTFPLVDLPEMCNETDSESVSTELPNFSSQTVYGQKPRIKRTLSSNESDSDIENLSGRPKRRRLRKRKELQSNRDGNIKTYRQFLCPQPSIQHENSWVQKHVFQTTDFQIPNMIPPPLPDFPRYCPPKPFEPSNNANKLPEEAAYIRKPNMRFSASCQQSNVKYTNTPNVIGLQEKLARERSLEDIRFSLKDQIEKLRRDKLEMEEKFKATLSGRSRFHLDSQRDNNDYHRELVLRALTVAHQKLDVQLDRLQASYDSLIAMKYKKMYQDLAIRSTDFI